MPPPLSPLLRVTPLEHRFAELQGRVQEAAVHGRVILGGDFNAHVACASSSTSFSMQHSGQDSLGRALVQLVSSTGLTLGSGVLPGDLQALPTYQGHNSLGTRPDHFIFSPDLCTYIQSLRVVAAFRGSDHRPLHVVLSLPGIPLLPRVPAPAPLSRIIWDASKRRPFVEALQLHAPALQRCGQLSQSSSTCEAVEILHATLKAACHTAGLREVPRRRAGPRRVHKPFFDSRAHQLKREWRRLCRLSGGRAQTTIQAERLYHVHVRSRKRAWLLTRLNECISSFYQNPRQFWQLLHGPPQGLPPPLRHPGAWQQFAQQFQGQCVPPALADVPSSSLSLTAFPVQVSAEQHELNAPFTVDEVHVAVAKLHSGRAPGVAGCPAELFRFAQLPRPPHGASPTHLLVPVLTDLLNAFFSSGHLPDSCNALLVSPVLKDSRKSALDTSNYRPIAVQEPIVRLYASVLNTRLVSYLEGAELKRPEQCGFRPNFSTLHAVFTLQHFIDRATPQQPLYCCFLDLSKAYDRVPRAFLWEALSRLGVGGTFLAALQSLYEDARFAILADGAIGDFLPSLTGLTQGSPGSPTLFTVYEDGLPRHLLSLCPHVGPQLSDGTHVPALMYADDIELLATSLPDLNLLLEVVFQWCVAHGMEIGLPKTEAMMFPSSGVCPPRSFAPVCQGVPIRVVGTKRYLGVMFSSEHGIGGTFPFLRGKLWAAWSALMRQYGNLQCAASIGLLLKVILACVVPTASYGCEVWACRRLPASVTSQQVLEADFLIILKMLVDARKTTATPIVFEELGVMPLPYHWLKRVATFWNSLQSLPQHHLFAAVFRDSYAIATQGGSSWAASFLSALRSVHYPYPNDAVGIHPIDMVALRACIRARVRLPWTDLPLSPRLCPSAGAQLCKYFRWFLPPSAAARTRLLLLRVSASRLRVFHLFRMGGHDLPIDALRRRRPPVPRLLRFCDMCHQRLVGDEQHFVFFCTALQPLRDAYSHLFPPGLHSLKRFMWQEDLSAVVHFISDAFSFRLSLLGGQ